jgi:outer membrane receptor protein involved in Fe transport
MERAKNSTISLLAAAFGLITLTSSATGQAPDSTVADSARKVVKLAPIAVTATRVERTVFRTASPLLVTDVSVIREESPNGVPDLFRNLPGVDVTGVGPNQARLIIRGQRGQRILLLEDGIRLNNSRRQQDFGELSALTDINNVAQVEIVRGPASVLYGTDAIGGVVNQRTLQPPGRGQGNALRGHLGYRYGSADGQDLVHGRLSGRAGRWTFGLAGTVREADPYAAPEGSFGNVSLAGRTQVHDTGVRDWNGSFDLGVDAGQNQSVALRVSRYEARDAGFGFVAPGDLGDPNGATVRILYPRQDVTRVSTTYSAHALGSALADRLSVTAYTNRNDRELNFDLEAPFGPPLPPGAGVQAFTRNTTDMTTYGARIEAVKVLGGRHSLTYGADVFVDRSDNTDSTRTVVTVVGPPSEEVTTTPSVPNAGYRSAGLFGQADFVLTDRLTLGLGVRGNLLSAWTRETPGLPDADGVSETDAALVGAVSASYALLDELRLVAVAGRAFRAPNLVERFFEGPTPEGSGFQFASPGLEPETSFNVDLGFKFRHDRVYAEAFYFRNTISDGIRIEPTGTQVGPFDGFRNVNVARLRDQGVELLTEVQAGLGFSVLAHYTRLSSKNADEDSPIGDSYSSKVGGELGWRAPLNRLFLTYEIRHQGERSDVVLGDSPVGATIPAFTVHNARAGFRLPSVGAMTPWLGVSVLNLTNRLYSEASNTSFFRPEPRRSVVATARVEF